MSDARDEHPTTPGSGTGSVPVSELLGGAVRKVGQWVVGLSKDEPFAVSGRCRHQLADLSKGSVAADGCLVCPWHGSKYDVRTGKMVRGPRGFASYHGPARGYRTFVKGYSQLLPLRRRPAHRRGDRVEVD